MDFLGVLSVFLASALGIPYHYGGNNPIDGYDCSGFVMEFMHMFDVGPKGDASAQMIYDYYRKHLDETVSGIGYDFTKPPPLGTLVFFGKDSKHISHIGLMINQAQMAEAGGGTRDTLTEREAANNNAYIKIRPYTRRKDVVDMIVPKYPAWSRWHDAVGMKCFSGSGVNRRPIDCALTQ